MLRTRICDEPVLSIKCQLCRPSIAVEDLRILVLHFLPGFVYVTLCLCVCDVLYMRVVCSDVLIYRFLCYVHFLTLFVS